MRFSAQGFEVASRSLFSEHDLASLCQRGYVGLLAVVGMILLRVIPSIATSIIFEPSEVHSGIRYVAKL